MQQLRGTGVALVTPFHEDFSVDYDGLTNVVNHSIDGGVDYLVVMGTTAENATLTSEEKNKVIAHVRTINEGRVPLVLGIGGNNTQVVISNLKTADFQGYDAVLSVSPYYNKPTQEGIYQHFKAIAPHSPLPIIIYNVPGRTGSNILPETTVRLARDIDNIIGIKEAAGDIVQALYILKNRPEGFLVISGDDMIALSMVSAGGDGVISVIGQGTVDPFCAMIKDGLNGAFAKAYEAQYKLMPVIDLIFEEGNPAGIKTLLKAQNVCGDTVRLPLVKATDALTQKITDFLKNLT